jgi:hypothetical protein
MFSGLLSGLFCSLHVFDINKGELKKQSAKNNFLGV